VKLKGKEEERSYEVNNGKAHEFVFCHRCKVVGITLRNAGESGRVTQKRYCLDIAIKIYLSVLLPCVLLRLRG
jgi:hypothetical protein